MVAKTASDLYLSSGFTSYGSDRYSTRNQEDLELIDAAKLGLLTAQSFPDTTQSRPDSHLSTFIDPLYTFSLIIFYLANDLEKTKMYDLMYLFASQIQWFSFEAILRHKSPIIQDLWSQLLVLALEVGDKSFFQSLIRILIKDPHLIEKFGVHALVIAACYDSAETCKLLVHHGVTPNQSCQIMASGDQEFFSDWRKRRSGSQSPGTERPDLDLTVLPLIEAALMGNIRSVAVLLDSGADVELRFEGLTATGHLLSALEEDNQNRENRFVVMKLLLERGADVNEPVRSSPSENGLELSHFTLLDIALASDDAELARFFRIFDRTPKFLLTISNIILYAEKGLQDLQSYLQSACFPRGLRRQLMQDLSLRLCFKKPKIFLTMLQADFDPALPHLGEIEIGKITFRMGHNDIQQTIINVLD